MELCRDEIDNYEEYKAWKEKITNITGLNEQPETVSELMDENSKLNEILKESLVMKLLEL